ncbi:MAG TPA: adenylate cyclase [Acidimicrobiia bacterium]|nr:adenylate cyclase [Acidimicrobiia bacterium]
MTTKTSAPGNLTAEELSTLLTLIKKADSVELKLTVPDSGRRSAIAALDVDPLDAHIRQVFFFDTVDLTLNKAGVVVRARRIQGRDGDSTVKLRPVVPDDLPPELRKSPDFGVEVDALPGGYVCSGSMKGVAKSLDVREVAAGKRPIRKLFTKQQRAFFADHAPEGLELDDLKVLGPINVFKLKFAPRDFNRSMVAELWNYPDGSRILELSTKCMPNEAFQVAAEARAFLTGHGIDLSAEQQTKTAAALEFFANEAREMAKPNAKAKAASPKSSSGL